MTASPIVAFEAARDAPFDAAPPHAPRIAWLNRRHFLAQGHDMHCPEVVARIERDCIAAHAVSSVPDIADPQGATAGGGGGQNDPVGRSREAPRRYAYHRCFLHDAIREAIAAELTDAELPNGAVPTVAIIDTGDARAEHPDGPPHRCAVAVRPRFFPVADLEHSIFFGSSQFPRSDANRHPHDRPMPGSDAGFDTMRYLERAVRQIAASRAHRLWNGRPATGNLTITARYFDFGAFRSLPDWGRGDDIGDLARELDSPGRLPRRYGGAAPDPIERQAILRRVAEDFDTRFSALCVRSCGAGAIDDQPELGAAFLNHYRAAQHPHDAIDFLAMRRDGSEWLGDAVAAHLSGAPVPAAARPLAALLASVLIGPSDDALRSRYRLLRMARWLKPRPSQYHGTARDRAIAAVRRADDSGDAFATVIDRHIRTEIAEARRVWNMLADDIVVLGVAVMPDYDAIFVYRVAAGRFDTLYQAVPTTRGASIRGEWIDPALVERGREPDGEPRAGSVLISDDRLIAAGHQWRFPVPLRPHHVFQDAMAFVTAHRGPAPWSN